AFLLGDVKPGLHRALVAGSILVGQVAVRFAQEEDVAVLKIDGFAVDERFSLDRFGGDGAAWHNGHAIAAEESDGGHEESKRPDGPPVKEAGVVVDDDLTGAGGSQKQI